MRTVNPARRIVVGVVSATLFLLAFTASTADAAGRRSIWEDANDGISGLDASSVALSPGNPPVIYAVVNGAFFRSVDSGTTWTRTYRFSGRSRARTSSGRSGASVTRRERDRLIEERTQDLAATYGEDRAREMAEDLERDAEEEVEDLVRRRRATAARSSRSGRFYRVAHRMVVTPGNPLMLIVATDGGAFVSMDSGISFRRLYRGRGSGRGDIRAAAINPSNVKRILLGTARGLVSTADGGKTWTRPRGVPRDLVIHDLAFSPLKGSLAFAATSRGVFRSQDGGKSFVRALNLPDAQNAAVSIALWGTHRITALVGTNRGLYRSNKGGRSFHRVTSSGLGQTKILKVVRSLHRSGQVFVTTPAGVFVSDNMGLDFVELRAGLPTSSIRDLVVHHVLKGGLFAATDMGVYRFVRTAVGVVTALQLKRFRSRIGREPGPYQVAMAAMRYVGFTHRRIAGMETRANLRALLPKIHVKGTMNLDRDATYALFGTPVRVAVLEGRKLLIEGVATWDLSRWIFPRKVNQVPRVTRTLLKYRRTKVVAITRLYHTRRRLQIRLFTQPPRDLRRYRRLRLRLRELSAHLDARTGGWFSKSVLKARKRARSTGVSR